MVSSYQRRTRAHALVSVSRPTTGSPRTATARRGPRHRRGTSACRCPPWPSPPFRMDDLRGPAPRGRRHACARRHRTLLTFGATFPGTTSPIDPTFRPDLPLLGFPKTAPPPYSSPRVHSRHPHRCGAFGRRDAISLHVPSSWFHTTSTACSSRTVRACCSALPAMGSTPFPSAAKPNSPMCLSALRSFTPAGSCTADESSVRARVTAGTIAGSSRSPRALPSHPFSSARPSPWFPTNRSR